MQATSVVLVFDETLDTGLHQNVETLSPEQEDFESFVGQIQDVAKDEEAACA